MAGLWLLCGTRQMLFFVYVVTFFGYGASIDQLPFLMWSTESLPPLAPPADGHIISTRQLTTYLNTALGSRSHTGLVFLQDKLSKDDFTLYGGVFGGKQDSAFQNLEAALQSSSSLVLPALAWHGSSTTIILLQEKLGVTPLLVDPDSLLDLPLDTSKSNLLVFSLPYCAGNEKSCKDLIRSNDEIIGKVMSIMKAKSISYTAIYTGLQPSRVIPELSMSPNEPMGRSLLQTVAPSIRPPIMFNTSGSPCIMLWAQNLYVDFNGGSNWTDLAAQTATLDGSLCNGSNSILVLNYPSGITLSFAMSMQFYPVSARNWFTLNAVQLQYRGQEASFIGSRNIYAPAEYSFHCLSVNSFSDPLLVPNGTNQNSSAWMVNFVDFQIQGFGLANGTSFSYASDCAGFFTAGIWMGLVTTLIMLLILVYGLHMIMQLNTMDRFDDPKGPAISVPQTD